MATVSPTSSAAYGSLGGGDSVRVCARIRPLNRAEELNSKVCVAIRPNDTDSLELHTSEQDTCPFTFSRVFGPDASQDAIYRDVGEPMIRDVLDGYNGCIFVYGQTGSGKTFTMMGAEAAAPLSSPATLINSSFNGQAPASARSLATPSRYDPNAGGLFANPTFAFDGPNTGIIPRAVVDLFDRINKADAELEFEIKLFFVEIYMEHVRDLLEPSRVNLNVREDPSTSSFYVEACECPYVSSAQEVLLYVEQGLRNRTTAATRMNDVSSRSHCLLGLTIKSNHARRGETKVGKLYLVDLAGTEKVAKTKAEGVQLEEAKLINKSLTTLGLVIKNLTESRAQHIPYRDSKLTKILQDALGGNSRTTLIICCSPSMHHCQETHSTLRFGARAKHIRNRAVVNKEYTVSELKNMLLVAQSEITRLKHGMPLASAPISGAETQEGMMSALEYEARMREMEGYYKAQLSAKDELLKEAQDAASAALRAVEHKDVMGQHMQEEIRTWQAEFNSLVGELALQSRRLDKERAVRTSDRSLLEKVLDSAMKTRHDLQWIRASCSEAMRELQLGGALRDIPAALHAAGEQSPAAEASQLSQESQRLSLGESVVFDTSGTKANVSAASQAPSQLHAPNSTPPLPTSSTIAALTQRLQLLEKQNADLELTWRELMNENGSLMLELQLADKKLAIRHDRIENLKAGLKQERQMSKEIQDDLENEKRSAKEKLLEARSDAEYWRHRFEAIQTSLQSGKPTLKYATSTLGFLSPQHGSTRVVKHIRGGVRSSPASGPGQQDD